MNKKKASRTAASEKKGHTGNVVPFFPSEWKKNANDVFNQIMNGQEPTESAEDVTHVAIYKKGPNHDSQSTSPFLKNKAKGSASIGGERPTSGKHFARQREFGKKKGVLEPPNCDFDTSSVAHNFEKSKKVEGLLNRLADYMAGDIPETGDLYDMFKNPNDKSMETPNDDDAPTADDATTAYTIDPPKKHAPLISISKEPIYGYTTPMKPKNLDVDDTEVETEPDLGQIPENPPYPPTEDVMEDLTILPNIYASVEQPSRNAIGRHT